MSIFWQAILYTLGGVWALETLVLFLCVLIPLLRWKREEHRRKKQREGGENHEPGYAD